MYLPQVSRYEIIYAVNQLARGISIPSEVLPRLIWGRQAFFRYLAGSTDFFITYKQSGFKLHVFSGNKLGNNPDRGNSKSSYIVMLANGLISFQVGLQGLTVQSTMWKRILVAASSTMQEVIICKSTTLELTLKAGFDGVAHFVDSTSVFHVA